MKILLVRGPGSHFQLIYNMLLENNISFDYVECSPKYNRIKVVNGKVVDSKSSLFFSLIDKMIAFICIRILKSKIYYNRYLLLFYSQWLKYNTVEADTIIACTQVALPLFQKYKGIKKLILEYPMIHPNEHKKLMDDYLKTHQIKQTDYISEQDKYIILQEIDMADCISVVSSFAKKSFVHHGIACNKIRVVPLFADPLIFKIEKDIVKFEKFTLLFVGRIEFQKGIYTLLEYIKHSSFELELILIGPLNDPFLLDKIKNIPFVHYLGVKNKDELVRYYNRSHIVILPSVQESFGFVLLESLMCGTPVMASHNTGISDVLIDNNLGVSFDLESQQDFIEKLGRIYLNYPKYGDRQNNREITNRYFNKDNFLNVYLKLIKN